MHGESAPFAGATPDRVAGMTGLGVVRAATPPELGFPVAPGEAFCPGAEVWAGAARAEAFLELHARGGAGTTVPHREPALSATIDERLPPAGWRRGVPAAPAMVREDHLFVVSWGGVAVSAGSHGELGLLDPASVFASRDGHRLPGAGALEDESPAMLRELEELAQAMSVERRLRARIVQIMRRAGVGTAVGMRLRRGLTHVQWPLLVGAPEAALAAAFDRLVASGGLIVEDRSLIVPWEAWPGDAPQARKVGAQ